MIAAVPSELLMGNQPQATGAGATAAAGSGFNMLLDMLMALEGQISQTAQAAQGAVPPADASTPAQADAAQSNNQGNELIDLFTGAGEQSANLESQPQSQPQAAQEQLINSESTKTVATPQAAAETVTTEVATPQIFWAQILAQSAQLHCAAATTNPLAQASTNNINNTVTVPAETSEAAAAPETSTETTAPVQQIQQPASPIAAVIQQLKLAAQPNQNTASTDEVEEIDSQTDAKQPVATTAQPTPTIVAEVKPQVSTDAPEAAKPEIKEDSQPATSQVSQVLTAAVVSIPAQAAKTAEPLAATESNQAAATPAQTPKSAKVVSIQSTPVQAEAPEAVPTTSQAQAQTATAPNQPATPFTWNLSELIHRFDEQLNQVMTDQPEEVAAKSTTPATPIATAPAAQTADALPRDFASALAKVAATEPKTETTDSDPTVSAPQQQTLTWAAEPVTDKDNNTRMPAMIEQVRQASEWMAEKAEGTIRMGDHGVEANMRLYPPDLGGVRVKINVTNDLNVQAQFIADRPEAAQAIKQNMSQLQEAFVRQGMTLESAQVVVAPAASSSNGSSSQQFDSAPRREPQTFTQQQNRQSEGRNPQERRQRQQA